jgi:hypothetical protein
MSLQSGWMQEPGTRSTRDELGFWWWTIGTVTGGLSLISLVQKVWQIGLAPLPKLLLEHYRSVLRPLHDLLVYIIPLRLPEWYIDAYVLSFLACSAYFKAWFFSSPNRSVKVKELFKATLFWVFCPTLLIGILMAALSPVMLVLLKYEFRRSVKDWRRRLNEEAIKYQWQQIIIQKRYVISLVGLAVATVAFFAWNFQAT